MRMKIHAFWLGLKEGFQDPHTECGLTWEDWRVSEAFDRGLNVGANARLFLSALTEDWWD